MALRGAVFCAAVCYNEQRFFLRFLSHASANHIMRCITFRAALMYCLGSSQVPLNCAAPCCASLHSIAIRHRLICHADWLTEALAVGCLSGLTLAAVSGPYADVEMFLGLEVDGAAQSDDADEHTALQTHAAHVEPLTGLGRLQGTTEAQRSHDCFLSFTTKESWGPFTTKIMADCDYFCNRRLFFYKYKKTYRIFPRTQENNSRYQYNI